MVGRLPRRASSIPRGTQNSQLGRETFWAPVEWADHWPIVTNGKPITINGLPEAGLERLPEESEQPHGFDPNGTFLPESESNYALTDYASASVRMASRTDTAQATLRLDLARGQLALDGHCYRLPYDAIHDLLRAPSGFLHPQSPRYHSLHFLRCMTKRVPYAAFTANLVIVSQPASQASQQHGTTNHRRLTETRHTSAMSKLSRRNLVRQAAFVFRTIADPMCGMQVRLCVYSPGRDGSWIFRRGRCGCGVGVGVEKEGDGHGLGSGGDGVLRDFGSRGHSGSGNDSEGVSTYGYQVAS